MGVFVRACVMWNYFLFFKFVNICVSTRLLICNSERVKYNVNNLMILLLSYAFILQMRMCVGQFPIIYAIR